MSSKKGLFWFFLIYFVACQKGGGGGGSRSRSSSRKSSGGGSSKGGANILFALIYFFCWLIWKFIIPEVVKTFIVQSYNKIISDITTGFTSTKAFFFQTRKGNKILDHALIAIFIIAFVILMKYFWETLIKEHYRDYLNKHRKNTQGYSYSQASLDEKFKTFCSSGISIKFTQQFHSYFTKPLIIVGKKSSQKCLYEINIKSSDEIGAWNASGYVGYSKQGMSIWFSKIYQNREKAGQTGKWKHLIYEGSSQTGKIADLKGKWFYKWSQNDKKYSGGWRVYFKDYL